MVPVGIHDNPTINNMLTEQINIADTNTFTDDNIADVNIVTENNIFTDVNIVDFNRHSNDSVLAMPEIVNDNSDLVVNLIENEATPPRRKQNQASQQRKRLSCSIDSIDSILSRVEKEEKEKVIQTIKKRLGEENLVQPKKGMH